MDGLFTQRHKKNDVGEGDNVTEEGGDVPVVVAENGGDNNNSAIAPNSDDVAQLTDLADVDKAGFSWLTLFAWVRDIFLTVAVLIVLFIIHVVYVSDFQNGATQRDLSNRLAERWSQEIVDDVAVAKTKIVPLSYTSDVTREFDNGQPMMQLRIPAIDVTNTVVYGVNQWDLTQGSGYYPDSALPGEKGNFAIAGHRIGKGAPFRYLDRLNTCDDIVVETENRIYTYKVLDVGDRGVPGCIPKAVRTSLRSLPPIPGRVIVQPTDVGVVSDVPYIGDIKPEAEGVAPLITLTTCHPEFGNSERMIIHGALVKEEEKIL